MKTVSCRVVKETSLDMVGIDGVSIAMGPDKRPRIAAHRSDKTVRYFRIREGGWDHFIVARATSAKGPNNMPVVDCYTPYVASSTVGDVVAWRNRMKGAETTANHGPAMCIILDGKTPGPAMFRGNGFTNGGVRPIFDGDDPAQVELWSKMGAYEIFDIATQTRVRLGTDSIGATGEHLAVATGGWRGFGGCSSKDNSRVMRRGHTGRVDVVDCDVFPKAGDDVYGYVGICANGDACYFFMAVDGYLRMNLVKDGVALIAPGVLFTIGPASRMPRHPVYACVIRKRVVAFWTLGGNIMYADVDGVRAGACKPAVLCAGDYAAAVTTSQGAALAVARKGALYLVNVETVKQ